MNFEKSINNKYFQLSLISLMLVFANVCSADEPPLVLGKGEPGQLVRSTKLLSMDGNVIKYEITYPVLGHTSIATVGFRTGVMREEVFERRWKVVYEHDDGYEIYGIPSRIIVYQYVDKSYNKKINEYKHEDTKLNQIFYRDQNGKVVILSPSYFRVGSGF